MDPYGAHSPLSDKRIARRWREENIAKLSRGQPDVVQKLLSWKGGKSGTKEPVADTTLAASKSNAAGPPTGISNHSIGSAAMKE